MTIKLLAMDYATETINIDPAYQRMVNRSQVRWIVQHYDEVSFGRILVAEREDGSLWAVDGQQRLTAARQRGMATVPCLVFKSEGRRHEARVFKEINDSRTSVNAMDVHKAALEAREPGAVAIQSVVEELGFVLRRGSKSGGIWNLIGSVATLNQIFRRGGTGLLRATLDLINKCWSGDTDATHNSVLAGLSWLLFKTEGRINIDRLEKKLKSISPIELMRYTKDQKRFSGSQNNQRTMAEAILAIYNKGLKTNRIELDPRPFVGEDETETTFTVESTPLDDSESEPQ